MFWQSPSALLVAKSAIASEGDWPGFWGNDAIDQKLHDIASSGPVVLQPDFSKLKAFDLSFAEAIREELRGTGVTVTALQPNATETHFFRRADMEDMKVAKKKKDSAALVAKQGFAAMMRGDDKIYGGSLKSRTSLPVPADEER